MQRVVLHPLTGGFERGILFLGLYLGGAEIVLQHDVFRNVPVDPERLHGAIAGAIGGADSAHVPYLAVIRAPYAKLAGIGSLPDYGLVHRAFDLRNVFCRHHAAPQIHGNRSISRQAV